MDFGIRHLFISFITAAKDCVDGGRSGGCAHENPEIQIGTIMRDKFCHHDENCGGELGEAAATSLRPIERALSECTEATEGGLLKYQYINCMSGDQLKNVTRVVETPVSKGILGQSKIG